MYKPSLRPLNKISSISSGLCSSPAPKVSLFASKHNEVKPFPLFSLPGLPEARDDESIPPHPLPSLEILDKMVAITKSNNFPSFEKVALICALHKSETTGTLLKAIIELGVEPSNIFLAGKSYSTSRTVEKAIKKLGVTVIPDAIPSFPGGYQEVCIKSIEQMWKKFILHVKENPAIDKIIILDDGGHAIELMPFYLPFLYAVAAIEQAREGLHSRALSKILCPVIAVASCAVKIHIESPLIAEAILKRLKNTLSALTINKETIFGVIGNEAIGLEVNTYLLSQGYKVVAYDENEKMFKKIKHKNLFQVTCIEQVFANAEYIFGCTGKDITATIPDLLNFVRRNQVWISGTPEDKAFRKFLLENKNKTEFSDIFGDIKFTNQLGMKITIKSGGFPFHLDRTSPDTSTQGEVTQACALASVIQAFFIARKPVGGGVTINRAAQYSLNPYLQSFIASLWSKREINQKKCFSNFFEDFQNNEEWIRKNSGGEHIEVKPLADSFKNFSEQPTVSLRAKL